MGVHRGLLIGAAVLAVAAACGEGDGGTGQGGPALPSTPGTAAVIATSTPATAPVTTPTTQAAATSRPIPTSPTTRAAVVPAPILGVWVQDDSGPAVSYQRRFEFRPDGSYQFVFTSRPTGSVSEQIVTSEAGRYSGSGDRLSLSPASGNRSDLGWRVDTDPYVGDVRLSLSFPDGTVGVYYRRG